MENPKLPDNDQDLLLAQQIGQALDNRMPLEQLEDSFIDQLLEAKKAHKAEVQSLSSESNSLWNAVEPITPPVKPKATILPFFQYTKTWAAAATILITVLVSMFWMISQEAQAPIAEAQAEMKEVLLADGTSVTLRPYSRLYTVEINEQSRSYALEGEAFFTVEHDEDRPFSVKAGEGRVTVLGTRFNLSTWGEKTLVYLEEGSVRVDPTNTEGLILEPGQAAVLSEGELNVNIASEEKYTDWMNNTLVLDNSTILSAINELEQHYNIVINIDEVDDPQEFLGGSLNLGEVEETLNDLATILSGTFRSTGEYQYRYIPLN